MAKNKVMLIILDGWGLSAEKEGNAPLLAKTPILDYVYATYPKTSLSASGLEVGLSSGEPGNSEVGHLNIGTGRVVWENLPRIDQEIESGAFFEKEALAAAIEAAKQNKSVLHLIGCVSDGGVHSHIRHLYALLKAAKDNGLDRVLVHFISDGRDTKPEQALEFAASLEKTMTDLKVGRIATLIGRYFAMDRDNNWDRMEKFFNLVVKNEGQKFGSIKEAIEDSYKSGKNDEFIEPSVIGDGGEISDGDSILIFNYRSDRVKQMTKMFVGEEKFFVKDLPKNLLITTMTEYNKDQKEPVIYKHINLDNALAKIISENSLEQFHIAETEKYAHVTYFLNAGIEKPYKGEDWQIIPSKKVATYDKYPLMSAKEVSEKLLQAIKKDYDFIVVNFANGDMVGHTGVVKAAIEACEGVDTLLKEVLSNASENGYKAFITADHGNCESMIDPTTKKVNKEHTTNPVPFIFLDFEKRPFDPLEVDYSFDDYALYATGTPIGVLADIAPSILANLGISQPNEMTGMDLSIAMI